jgi:hypothetical protein
MAIVPAKANGDPDAQDAETPEIVTPSSDKLPDTLTLKFPPVSAEPEIVNPDPLGPPVEEMAIPTIEFA